MASFATRIRRPRNCLLVVLTSSGMMVRETTCPVYGVGPPPPPPPPETLKPRPEMPFGQKPGPQPLNWATAGAAHSRRRARRARRSIAYHHVQENLCPAVPATTESGVLIPMPIGEVKVLSPAKVVAVAGASG